MAGSVNGSEGMRVIGAGLGRTGTTSLEAALTHLGYKPYHMKTAMSTEGHLELWQLYMQAVKAEQASEGSDAVVTATDAVIDAIIRDGFDATTDYPACHIYPRLMERFPDAIVLLGVRSSGTAWADSILSTIGRAAAILSTAPFHFVPSLRRLAPFIAFQFEATGLAVDTTTRRITSTRDEMGHAHDEWARSVQAAVPADKLLTHQPGQGWAPICAMLGAPVPSEPYPHLNDSKQIQGAADAAEFVANVWWPVVIVLTVAACYCHAPPGARS